MSDNLQEVHLSRQFSNKKQKKYFTVVSSNNQNSIPNSNSTKIQTSKNQYYSIKNKIQNYTNHKTKDKDIQKKVFIQQNGHKSQRFVNKYKPYQIMNNKQIDRNVKYKIYRSHSDKKSKAITENCTSEERKNQFLIRIPKNQHVIQNYIEQLKKIKRKLVEEREQTQIMKVKCTQYSVKKTQQIEEELDNIYAFRQHKSSNKKLVFQPSPVKQEQITQKRLYPRDKKKHLTKLKFIKQFIHENQNQFQKQQSNKNQEQNYKINKQKQTQKLSEDMFKNKLKFICPQKIIIGDIINVKQQIKFKNPYEEKLNTNSRYLNNFGRKLYAISKSTQLRKQKTAQTNQSQSKVNSSNEKFNSLPYSKSLVLKKKMNQIMSESKIKNVQLPYQQPNRKIQEKIKIKSPTKLKLNNNISQNKDLPFKSIEGFSTIQDKKQTLDILGQSCLNIKKNLIESGQKMDHILDLLGIQTKQFKAELNGKQKKKKQSYDRFSKVFPKGFFK